MWASRAAAWAAERDGSEPSTAQTIECFMWAYLLASHARGASPARHPVQGACAGNRRPIGAAGLTPPGDAQTARRPDSERSAEALRELGDDPVAEHVGHARGSGGGSCRRRGCRRGESRVRCATASASVRSRWSRIIVRISSRGQWRGLALFRKSAIWLPLRVPDAAVALDRRLVAGLGRGQQIGGHEDVLGEQRAQPLAGGTP